MNKEKKQVLEIVKSWNEAFAKNQVEEYFGFIHEELSLFIPASPYRIEGKTDDKEEFEWSLKNGRTMVSLFQELQPVVQMLGKDAALVTYHTRGAIGPEGQENLIYLKETNVLVREKEQWKVIHIHVSK